MGVSRVDTPVFLHLHQSQDSMSKRHLQFHRRLPFSRTRCRSLCPCMNPKTFCSKFFNQKNFATNQTDTLRFASRKCTTQPDRSRLMGRRSRSNTNVEITEFYFLVIQLQRFFNSLILQKLENI